MTWTDIFGTEDEIIFATKRDDILSSFYGDDVMFAGQGDDRIFVGDRDATVFVFGGRGEDTLCIAASEDTAQIEQYGRTTVITTDDGLRLFVRGVEHIDWVF